MLSRPLGDAVLNGEVFFVVKLADCVASSHGARTMSL